MAFAMVLGSAALRWLGAGQSRPFPDGDAPRAGRADSRLRRRARRLRHHPLQLIFGRTDPAPPTLRRARGDSRPHGGPQPRHGPPRPGGGRVGAFDYPAGRRGALVEELFAAELGRPGFQTSNRLTAEYRVPRNKYPTPNSSGRFIGRSCKSFGEIPGARSASAILALPFSGNGSTVEIALPDRPMPPRGSEERAWSIGSRPERSRRSGVPLERGRYIDERDHAKSGKVAVVSRTFARALLAGPGSARAACPHSRSAGRRVHDGRRGRRYSAVAAR